MNQEVVLELNKVDKVFGGKYAVSSVNIKLVPGEIYGFLGPNGAGKTTTIRMIMNFIKPTNGQVKLFGEVTNLNNPKVYEKVGFLSADSALYPNWNAKQHIKFIESIKGASKNVNDLITKLKLDVETPYQKLSSGNKQKIALILALMNEPQLLVLDEPTRGLDPLLQQEIYNILIEFKDNGGTVFMSSHNLTEVQKICDRVGIIRQSKLVASETLETLRKKNIHEITLQTSDKINLSDFTSKNVEIISSLDNQINVHVHGDLNQFMKNVAKYHITDLEVNHISLDELFLRYYK